MAHARQLRSLIFELRLCAAAAALAIAFVLILVVAQSAPPFTTG